ncbi:hypothetical protein B0H13DRAFT_1857109 [Mycena leptocephala]|nr:hypothetical protein B0H13DRAFT_1857109 [Mycena leptocephala]
MRIKDFDLGLLRRPDYDALKHGELDSDSESDDDIDVDANNDDECSSEDLPGQSLTVVDVMDVDEDVGVNAVGQPSEQACIEGEELEYESDRGVRGHAIVYPQQPSAIAKILPPLIDEVITPICVIFVGSNPPTSEWLQKKAKPLTVHKEKVLNALYTKTSRLLYRRVW